jgi:nitroreductase
MALAIPPNHLLVYLYAVIMSPLQETFMIFSKPITEVIQQRFSCRNYQAKPIDGHTQQSLVEFAQSVTTGPFGTKTRFKLVAASDGDSSALKRLGTYGFIKSATGFIIGKMAPGEGNLEEFGYQMERIILHATDLDLGTCWLGGTFTKSSFGEKMTIPAGEIMPAVTSVGYIASQPRQAEQIIRRRARADRRLPWEILFFDGNFDSPLTPAMAGVFSTPLEMVRIGPSASNKQPWRVIREANKWHFYLQRTPGYRERLLVRIFTVADMQRLDMGIAMCHFELTSRELGYDGHWEFTQPGIPLPDSITEYTATWVS